jgi:hypothetical protein
MSLQGGYKFPHLDTTKKQIRLLRLQSKARHANLLQYELRTFDLETAPNYQALSYTWGPESPTYPIRVNNRKHHVRANLYAFLKGVAIKDYMWIDQICIDQSNSEEKSFVVKMMSQIYRDCDSMTIWLGSQEQGFREAATDFTNHDVIRYVYSSVTTTLLVYGLFKRYSWLGLFESFVAGYLESWRCPGMRCAQ